MNDEPQIPSNSERFRKMADRIEHNADAGFGGACVFVPPSGGGEPIEILMIDNGANPAQFYSTVATRIQLTLDQINNPQPFGAPRR
jgi:hypothetical protein